MLDSDTSCTSRTVTKKGISWEQLIPLTNMTACLQYTMMLVIQAKMVMEQRAYLIMVQLNCLI